MKKVYFYLLDDEVIDRHNEDDPLRYYTKEEIDKIEIYPETEELWKIWEEDVDSSLWVIHDVHKAFSYSTDPVMCESVEEARSYLGESLNFSIYERIYDL